MKTRSGSLFLPCSSWWIGLLLLAGPVRAEPRLEALSVHLVGQVAPDLPWRDGPLDARLGDGARLAVVVRAQELGERGKRTPVVVADDEVRPLVLSGKLVAPDRRRPFSRLGPVSVRWLTVEPHAWREEGVSAPNGASCRYHSNVSVEPATFGRWLGFDAITYFETEVAGWSAEPATRIRPATVRPSQPEADHFGGLGTLRYRVELQLGPPPGKVLSTPGASAVDRYGIRPEVFRVSLRRDDTYLGWLSSFFLVPEVFGSAGPGFDHQTDRRVGADCADVLTGALRAMGYRQVQHSHVAGLTRYAQVVAGPQLLQPPGNPGAAPGPEGILPGDILRIDYGGELAGHTPRSWDHVAALWEDRSDPAGPQAGGPDGRLDGYDLVVHVGHPRLALEPLGRQLPARIDVLRWQEKKLGRRSPP